MSITNKYNVMNFILITICLTVITTTVSATPDYAREKRWKNEITPELIISDAIYLTQKNGHSFLGLLAETDKMKPAIVLVHGMGLHPDWGFIGTIRRGLYDARHTTFSIQMPILAANASFRDYPALFPDAAERINLAVTFLKNRGFSRIVVLSHSNGSRMTRVYMKTYPEKITSWISLSLTQGDTYKGIHTPVFDIYGEVDLPHVLNSVQQRKRSLINKTSRQLFIPGADHFFTGQEDTLINILEKYLKGL